MAGVTCKSKIMRSTRMMAPYFSSDAKIKSQEVERVSLMHRVYSMGLNHT